ncbi:MAG: shikimate kinase [Sulfitobacter sp.]
MSENDTSTANIRRHAPRYRLKKTVALVGMMGAGKTAVGRAVALKLDAPFLDSDAEIEAAANLSVPEIFQRDGESFFRKRETEVIRRLLETQSGILSTGGGAYLAQVNRENIADKGVALWLDADLDLLWNRVRHKDTRPLLRTENPRATLSEIFDQRTPIYGLAELRVGCSEELSIDAMADCVIEILATRPDVLEQLDDPAD